MFEIRTMGDGSVKALNTCINNLSYSFYRSEVQVGSIGLLLRAAQGSNQVKAGLCSLLEALGEESTPKLAQVVGQIQFLVV